ncbi:MAG TPA: ABC transporter ATP-binding protein [Acidimicrobiales bacterium]|nr:ABC transporter ATP-binding protein [Acidimicrobiales bacterium]
MNPIHAQNARDPYAPLLAIDGLEVEFRTAEGTVNAVRGVDLELRPGEVLGIVGESGSGKSVTAMAAMGLLPRSASVRGSVRFRGEELLHLRERQLMPFRGKAISMIFQDPMTSLNPVYSVGWQIVEAIRAHQDVSKEEALQISIELLRKVGIPNPEDRVANYPHEFSGGMRQRVVIAIAIANNPEVILADEPTTALDVTVQAQVLDTLRTALEMTHAALLLITHDLGVIAGIADRVLVMYAGRPVEIGTVDEIFYNPSMPYTLGLLGSLPRVDTDGSEKLRPIPGSPPSMIGKPTGCPFAPRCPLAADVCQEREPELAPVNAQTPSHLAACHFTKQAHDRGISLFIATSVDLDSASENLATTAPGSASSKAPGSEELRAPGPGNYVLAEGLSPAGPGGYETAPDGHEGSGATGPADGEETTP